MVYDIAIKEGFIEIGGRYYMKIEGGRYYTLNTTEEGFEHEKYVMLVFPRPEKSSRTVTPNRNTGFA